MGGVSAAVAKTSAAPIERVKLLIQAQVRLSPPYAGARARSLENVPLKAPYSDSL
jgi:hypothetical protein